MHPMVKPALRRGWRDLNTVQFGMAPAHAMVLGPVDTATGSFLGLLDGTRGLPLLREEARRMGLPDGHADAVVDSLSGAGLLDDATGGGPGADALRAKAAVLERLRPDLASLSLVARAPGEAARRLAARRSLRVQVRGAGRVGAVLASLLAGAGVGEVDVRDTGCAEPWDVAPGGLPADAIGERREEAARRAVRAAAPDRPPRRGRPSRRSPHEDPGPGFSLVILTPRDGLEVHAPDPFAAEPLITSGTPPSVRGGRGGYGNRRPVRPAGRHRLRGLSRPGARRPGRDVATAGRPVALRAPTAGPGVRPRSGDRRRGSGGRTRARLLGRRHALQRGRALGGVRAPAPLACATGVGAFGMRVRCGGER